MIGFHPKRGVREAKPASRPRPQAACASRQGYNRTIKLAGPSRMVASGSQPGTTAGGWGVLMAEIKVVAGSCGKGRGQYEAGVFTTPDGAERGVDAVVTIESHGGIAGERNWGEQVLTGLKGGLGLASNLDLTGRPVWRPRPWRRSRPTRVGPRPWSRSHSLTAASSSPWRTHGWPPW